ncbi:MAG TPA: ATP-binding protein [Acidimicrobiales bacterium]|nr:ATP-binding protein [Acidimicrobiales bacterium]
MTSAGTQPGTVADTAAELAGDPARTTSPPPGHHAGVPPGNHAHDIGRPRRHLGLRARVTTTFALGALVLSGVLASVTYLSVRSSVVNQQESSLTHEAIASAESLRGAIQVPNADYPQALASFDTARGSESLLESGGQWYPSSPTLQRSVLPAPLRSLVLRGQLAEQIVTIGGTPELIVGVPINTGHGPAGYFQLFNLSEVQGTLRALFGSLVLAAVVTTLGGAVVGRWGASRALRPLHQTAQAALSIAKGRLGTRLESDAYADLAVLTSAFNEMADGLQERIAREVRFTSDVNHELRSPLTTVATALSVLEARRDELPERARQALDLLGAEVRRFRRLVDDLLEISRLDAGLGDMNAEEVSLGPLVQHSVAATRRTVLVDIPEKAADRRVLVDKVRFERVMANLIENAERYAGGATRVAVVADARWSRIAVEDRGPGIPPEERERIFDRFSRGSSARRRGMGDGTGLGLAIVAEHARVLGGRVWVEPNGSRGSRFVIEMPVLPASKEH